MLGNYLIGLREGLEAALVVTILIAYLVRTGRRDALRPVWAGVGVAVALSVGFGIALSAASAEMQFKTQEFFGGTLSILAVGLVTWMVFWMRRTARFMKAELEGRLSDALSVGPVALAVVALLAVGREGLETALFLWTNINSSADGSAVPITGALLGLATAVVIGYLLYRGGLKLNLTRFFTWTGAALIVVAAGVFGYGFHDLQEADVLPGLTSVALRPGLFFADYGTFGDWVQHLLQGVLNVTPQITWLQLAMWAAYLVPVMTVFLWRSGTPAPRSRPAAQRTESAASS
ncbi:iron uptake transporter permease EfeU [Actinomadura rayongensis]|uniref:Iron transporter n=1 Tax=Actinomadura rayongensis TaxID=1429076 RepID=A0A6I4WC11_9ACTN|nr:iron uptake transporter permease EfeU [Actinomadura rayongensis]MXQ66360.1 iron transporter [Actinomadura rayongensis]